ncbi:MAG: VanW family protein [Clostridia bacterium]|nr:VanW family protein [Clostridia bacterium]
MRRALRAVWTALILLAALTVCAAAEEKDTKETPQFYGVIGTKMHMRYKPQENASSLMLLEPGTVVDVYSKGRTWTRMAHEGRIGYVKTKYIELVQRKDPFQGPMPGTRAHAAVGFVLEDTSFTAEGYKSAVRVSRGAWLSIEKLSDGKAYFPYMRAAKNASVSADKLRIYEFIPWDEAKPGDLLHAFTTFYSTSQTKEGNTGRMYNIALAAQRLTGIRIEPGESFSFNAICAPYTRENGYKTAPVLGGESDMGYGGGVCQVCSTIYNIALRVPTVIEDMNWHAQAGTSYLPGGFDATVSDEKDMVFRNILPYALRLEFESQDGVMTAFLFRDYE